MRKYLYKVPEISIGRKFRLIVLSLSSILLMTGVAYAQTAGVSGTVVDEEGEPLIGAVVTVKGTTNAAITDLAGEFSLTGAGTADGVLVFTYVGYTPLEVPVGGRSRVDVALEPDVNRLDEVVVVGYGSLAKKEISSSIVQVSRADFNKGATTDALDLLIGKVAGLNINQTSAGDPNSGAGMQIRGVSSLKAGNEPLLIVDGVAGGSLRAIAPQDIASMTVLKDAASTAIYGTRGANGVILVTTKRGTGGDGAVSVTYDSYFAYNAPVNLPRILTAEEFRRSRKGNDYGYNTNWWDEIANDFSYDHNQYLSVDGTSASGSYGGSINWKDATGMDIKSARREWGGRFYFEQRMLNNRLQINGSMNVRRVNETWKDTDFGAALVMNPTLPVYNEDGTYYQPTSPTGAENPVAEMNLVENNGQRLYAMGAVEARLYILQNATHSLNTSFNYAMDYNDLKQAYFTPSNAAESFHQGYSARARVQYQKWWKDRMEWLANYTLDTGDHSLKAVAGFGWEKDNWETMWMENRDFMFDSTLWHDMESGSGLGEGLANMDTGKSESKIIGFFGRVNYNWKDRVMVSAAFRREGSTKFGANNKWGNFPSVSAAWEIANMPFMAEHRDIVNSLKVRASYGQSGRSGIDNYLSLATYSPDGQGFIDGRWIVGYRPSVNANPNLKWEVSKDTNIGVDFAFWNRLRGSVEWYDKQSVDLLNEYNAPQPPYVHRRMMLNLASIQNRGVEVTLNYDLFNKKDFDWTTGIVWSTGKTKLTKIGNDIFTSDYLDIYAVGGLGNTESYFRIRQDEYIGQYYGYEAAGVVNGVIQIRDGEGNAVPIGTADGAWKRHLGNAMPRHFLSWTNTLRYKNWDLDLFFTGAFDFLIYNNRRAGIGMRRGAENSLLSAFREEAHESGGVISSYFLERGDYFKLQNATLGYNFKLKSNNINSLRLYLSARNVFTLTGYSGNDPATVRVTGLNVGVDNTGAYPSATQISFGVTLNFK